MPKAGELIKPPQGASLPGTKLPEGPKTQANPVAPNVTPAATVLDLDSKNPF
jgi:hypothetical protein